MISIVTGTYNRLKYLSNMVASVRKSVGSIPYEIVVVDGGSTDGTVNWCKVNKQDIVLIEHGSLLGAVKAFNDGALKARGKYVILANDDIEFVDESIQAAFTFMEDNLDVGIGCFYQDRRGWEWHVEQMPAVLNGKQISTYYGQVCIVRRWLGNFVGWWGNYLRTYGGDNELSCNVLELGYKISPIPCACIHDFMPQDGLRVVNNDKVIINGKHPDSQAWTDKWTRNGKLGPVIVESPTIQNPDTREYRILYAPIYERGHDIQKQQKRGLREALSKIAVVSECDYVHKSVDYIFDLANIFKPDMILTQVQSVGEFTDTVMRELRAEHQDTLFVNWNGDYHPEHLLDPRYIRMLKYFHLSGFVTTSIAERYNQERINWFYWQIGYEEANVKPLKDTPRHDVLFLGNGYSEARLSLVRLLRSRLGSFGLYGYWPAQLRPNGNNLYNFDDGARLYKNCKITISDSQWPKATGFVSNRLFQAMSAGAFMLQQEFDGMTSLLGLESGVHLVTWNSHDDLLDKIQYYLEHDSERKAIAAAGCEYIRKYHSFDARVQELIKRLRNE